MKEQRQLLNWRWTVADTDRIRRLALAQKTATEIADEMNTSAAHIVALCYEMGIFVRAAKMRIAWK